MSSKNVVLKDTFGNQIFPATTAEQVSYDGTKNMKRVIDTVNAHATVANEAADMTDETKIYVYTGSETGYTFGHWYYHDGSEWTDGGEYMSGDTDESLSVSGRSADAKATGDALHGLEERVEALEQGGAAGDGIPSEVRKAILALLEASAYAETGIDDEMTIIQAWASTVTAISLNSSSTNISGSGSFQLVATTTPAGGSVIWSTSDDSVATVSSSGLVTGVGNGTCRITATSGDVHATCTVTVSGFATLTGISAVYSGGTVREGTTLDSLKADTTVTATYSDSSTVVLQNDQYTLSGTLVEGTSTITASFGGKTDTFNVVVTGSLIHSWDFTDSLVDSVSGVTATTTATQDSTGLHFTSGQKYAEFPAVYGKNRTYEIDVTSILRSGTALNNYGRLFMIDADNVTGTGGSGYLLTGSKKGGDLFYMNGAWESRVIVDNTTDSDGSYYNGSTVGFYIDADGYISVYKDGNLLGTSQGALSASYDENNVYIGSSSNQDALQTATFTALRVYEGNKYGGA